MSRDIEDEEESVAGDGLFPCGVCSQSTQWNEDVRFIRFGKSVLGDESADAFDEGPLPGNKVKTSKYTVLNFACKNFYEQMQRMANVWFFILSFLMYLGYYTDLFPGLINPWPTLGTLLLMMSITAASNAFDDISRCQADKEMNEQVCQVACMPSSAPGSWRKETRWQELVVGNLIIVCNGEQLPADMVCLASAGNEGLAFVSTANLDGETNLKNKHAVEITQEAFCGKTPESLEAAVLRLQTYDGMVEAEAPGWDVNSFNGKITFGGQLKPLGAEQVMLRGTVLRNTPWCIGLVIYTGEHTRMMKNARPTPLKSPTLDTLINRAVGIIIVIQALMALISTLAKIRTRAEYVSYWYLQPLEQMILPEALGNWLGFFLLYSNLVPVSLFATIEACNMFQSKFINNDKEMFDDELNVPACARSRNLCQEPGQINYIFSDKTGTLTQNVMDLKQLSIAGTIYGAVDNKKGFSAGDEIRKAKMGKDKEAVEGFLEILGVAHTVIVDQSGGYEAESPDESALVEAVAKLGYALQDRQGHDMHVRVGDGDKAKSATYTILAINNFTSARARMSALVKRDTGEYVLLAKGADSKMLERATGNNAALVEDLHKFSCEGLRTLVLGRRKLNASEAQSLVQEYEQAHLAADKEKALAAVAEKMEKNLEILGATAIEDKLQEGVGQTIEAIRRAGIKLWVLTGDKLETARNIGFSCKVLSKSMSILVLENVESEADLLSLIDKATDNEAKGTTTAMMCTGAALKQVMDPDNSSFVGLFLELAKLCSVVIACRVAPLQKAEMVNIVSEGVKTAQGKAPITLAIGDGANDVPMIQAAKVGVGIYGKEGRQAVNNSDFAIGQFRFLQRLLFVHGRWNYIRAAKVVLFTFWRNAVLVLSMFYYTFSTGNTGVPLFEDMVRGTFNVVTFIPTVAAGIMDKDFEANVVMRTPECYATGRDGKLFNVQTILETMLSAFIHSFVILIVMRTSYEGLNMSDVADIYSYGTIVFTVVMLAVNYRLIGIMEAWNWIFWLSVIVGCGLFYVVLLTMNSAFGNVAMLNFPQMYQVANIIVTKPLVWVCLATAPACGMVMDLFKRYIWSTCPGLKDEHLIEALQAARDAEWEKENVDVDSEKFAYRSGDVTDTGHDFNHPGTIRHPSTLKPPAASTLKDMRESGSPRAAASATPESYSRLNDGSDDFREDEKPSVSKIGSSAFMQQEVPVCWNTCNSCVCASTFALLIGIGMIFIGIIIMLSARNVTQARIHYDGLAKKSMFGDVWGTLPGEVTTSMCPVGSPTCHINVQITQDMQPPILVFYDMFPFYQNFFDYYNSVYWPELLGLEANKSNLYTSKCVKSMRETPEGELISPCGMQAKALFNDTFRIEGIPLDETNIAWPTDVRRFKNPPGYPLPPSKGWLYNRFPSIINKTSGVKNEHFANWIRPDAYAEVRKPYAHIRQPLLKGQNITVVIDAHFPVSQLGSQVRKELVLTTLSPFGARDETFAWLLVFAGAMCMAVSILICVIESVVKTFDSDDDGEEESDSEYCSDE